ncbi:predicted protein [Nematostella vectensis]|uniref:Alanyl-transfer RNA synthetases family profile domain-containing protein n=1 Tax=Nematostella vectensis TaxID=45351 RepID=A7RHY7_NEMVE|nr:predicted protein [Nematostella vectensis]|eukprot:XP_001641121.1 predicted protein [Nematostella vectensis]
MVFACQKDSFLKEFKTEVVSCKPAKQNKKDDVFEVVLEDTILFPEGGGQPDDKGMINGIEVLQVFRRGRQAVHVLSQHIDEGAQASLVLDWERRFDHMQQHSGQHLLSALIENKFGYKTTSWELGRVRSHIELHCKCLTPDEIACIESSANAAIRGHVPVCVHVYPDKTDPELEEAQTRGLPDDHIGPIRVIEIKGIDKNMCCGTHVDNLSQVQAVKLFPDVDSMRGGCRLFFLCGDRVFKHLGRAMENDRALSKCLSCGPDEHTTAVERIQTSLRLANKSLKSQLREIAYLEASQIKSSLGGRTFIYIHRENGDMDYINTIVNELGSLSIPLLVTVGPDKGPGQFLLLASEAEVNELGPRLSELMEGKGGGKKKPIPRQSRQSET